MQGRHAVRDASVYVGAKLDECGQDVGVVERRRHDDRTHEAELTSLVDIRPALLDQQTCHGVEAVADGPIQRRRSFVVLHVRVGTELYQRAHCILGTGRDVRVEREREVSVI